MILNDFKELNNKMLLIYLINKRDFQSNKTLSILIFLSNYSAKKKEIQKPFAIDFINYYGPFSLKIREYLKQLSFDGLIKIKYEKRRYQYIITNKGLEMLKNIVLEKNSTLIIDQVFDEYSNKSFEELMIIISRITEISNTPFGKEIWLI